MKEQRKKGKSGLYRTLRRGGRKERREEGASITTATTTEERHRPSRFLPTSPQQHKPDLENSVCHKTGGTWGTYETDY